MNNPSVKINYLLLPFAVIYGMVVRLRNKLFDWGVLRSRVFPLPVICIGNLTVGGTGKTPHTEHVAGVLRDVCRTAVLSRGYGRRTHGFILADESSDAATIGDEPKQMKDRFGDSVIIAVDESRTEGLDLLLASNDRPGAVVLDDAYQHRYVKPSLTVLLTSYERPFTCDALLPAGRLRENRAEKHRADIIIMTKCPADMAPIDYRIAINEIKPFPYQELFFTTLTYGDLHRMDGCGDTLPLSELTAGHSVLLVTGIANPTQLRKQLEKRAGAVTAINFPDHHSFTRRDLQRVVSAFQSMRGDDKIIVTTEKDAARLRPMMEHLGDAKDKTYVLPVKVKFLLGQEEKFNNIIKRHVRENT